jgi:acylphosphatase
LTRVSKQPDVERRIVLFQGRVQGVGFRYTTRQIAADFAVSGFVENLADGRVRLVCEGPPRELDRFIAEIGAQMDRYVQSTQTSVEAASGEFSGFGIRR